MFTLVALIVFIDADGVVEGLISGLIGALNAFSKSSSSSRMEETWDNGRWTTVGERRFVPPRAVMAAMEGADDAPPDDKSAVDREPSIEVDMSVTSETSKDARLECFSSAGVHLFNPFGSGIQGFVALARSSKAAVGGGDIGEKGMCTTVVSVGVASPSEDPMDEKESLADDEPEVIVIALEAGDETEVVEIQGEVGGI